MNGKIEIEKTSQKFLDKKLQYLSNKNGFLGIDNKFNFKEKVVIVPFGLEKTVSYGGGTKNGPKEIIKTLLASFGLYNKSIHGQCLQVQIYQYGIKIVTQRFINYVQNYSILFKFIQSCPYPGHGDEDDGRHRVGPPGGV